ncbi:PepSY domain-containing protein [Bradyrhizobium sp. AUGA SZCCT0169]|uniref:PepSY domain-containing protein n=1 Tax=Bradyrhizobium sp. AUGA SZCCT0169 TaxID=2807663 RepID=UPI002012C010|nr:PepSY domain-containing protein [Bradyrhizobium sp. AUGA SZCCT0169]
MSAPTFTPCTCEQRKQPMSNKQRFAVILLSLLALVPPYAIPPLSATQAAQEEGAEGERIHQEAVNRELEAFRAAQLSLRQAMGIAEKRHAGSRTADISFDGASGSPVYRVKTVQDNRLWEHAIDAKTGDTIGAETVSHLKDLNPDDRNNVMALRTIRQELSDAVIIAEQVASGRAIGGSLMDDNGKLNFVIVVVSGGSDLKQVVLEPPQAKGRGSNARHGSR